MIRRAEKEEAGRVATLVREAFMTVADEFGFTQENAPGFTPFSVSQEKSSGSSRTEGP